MKQTTYDSFPWLLVVICNGVGISIWVAGAYLTYALTPSLAVGYAIYCIWIEWRILSASCRRCYYYGKRCGFGKGLVCSRVLPRLPVEEFADRQVTWRDIAPDFLVSLIPLGAGVILLVRGFSWFVVSLMILIILLSSVGSGLVRGRIACKYCKQREIGCPAEKLFGRKEGDCENSRP
jgi:hypothetical protein